MTKRGIFAYVLRAEAQIRRGDGFPADVTCLLGICLAVACASFLDVCGCDRF